MNSEGLSGSFWTYSLFLQHLCELGAKKLHRAGPIGLAYEGAIILT